MKLSSEQKTIIKEIVVGKNGIKYKQIVTLGGYAGTGKTVTIQHLKHILPTFAVCAYTGKAADVLRKKGLLDASTIHSLIYRPLLNSNGTIALDKNGSPIFILAESLEYDGIIVDEASMVGKEIYEDLLSFGLPIIFVGDHGQLEPVNSDFNIMKNPQFKLEEIHRNAGEIAYFAQHIRKGFRAATFNAISSVEFIPKYKSNELFTQVDQIICAFNKTRVEINKETRKQLWNVLDNWPIVGDRIMCLKNNKKAGIFNGMQGKINKIGFKGKNSMEFEANNQTYEIFFDPFNFNKEKYEMSSNRDDPHPFDFCYAATCHKCQGDEWDVGLVIEQKSKNWDHKRWAYTAASRFKKKIFWCES